MHSYKNIPITVEICCDGADAALAAFEAGADRVELCREKGIGGVTPLRDDIRRTVEASGDRRVHVLVRPRGGDFVYSESELQQMLSDIAFCAEAGADAVVVGALTRAGKIDIAAGERLVRAAQEAGLDVTWHRAIDVAADPLDALEDVLSLGVDRVLTSGGAPSAWEGRETIAAMVVRCEQRFLEGLEADEPAQKVIILPGAGVTADNVRGLLEATGATEVHGSRLEILKALNEL